MSEILIVQIINLILQIIFDIILKIVNKNCTNKSNIASDFINSILGSIGKIIFYFFTTIILLSIYNKQILINGLILFLSSLLYFYIHFKIQYFGC